MEKSLVKRLARFVLAASVLLAAVSCSGFKDIRITSFGVESISPRGFTAADAVLEIGIHNPAPAFTVSDIRGEIMASQTDTAAVFSGGPVDVERKCDQVYQVPFSISLAPSMSLLKAAAVVGSGDFSDYFINLQLDVNVGGGAGKTIRYDNLSIDELLNKATNN